MPGTPANNHAGEAALGIAESEPPEIHFYSEVQRMTSTNRLHAY